MPRSHVIGIRKIVSGQAARLTSRTSLIPCPPFLVLFVFLLLGHAIGVASLVTDCWYTIPSVRVY